ncbi:hypothetical protein FNH22_18895 [Fulvivirga sp. M361]|uniref:hypothetical protein n=1 Tax=Fulvivirga sp. M361 TaxID=2594266 RepID=UPI00117B6155|nr:hypothetical protein [Fulvivirga sp. M361]TRX54823.1 hypothetical protein FNH22_18895 [Fulvivirga sp. M361]
MLKVGLIGDGMDKTLLQRHPVLLNRLVHIDGTGTLKAEFYTDQLNAWVGEEVKLNGENRVTSNTKVISLLLQAMTSYDDIAFNIAQVPMFPAEDAMTAFTTALQWMAEVIQPDFVHVSFSSQEGKYQRQQNEWVQKLHEQGCKIICPVGVPPAFPALLEHVISVSDRGFMEAGFTFSNPDVIVDEKSVVVYENGTWVKQALSNETASALVLSKMIRTQITSSRLNEAKPVRLPDLDKLNFTTVSQPNNDHEFSAPPKPKFSEKARWYLKSMLSRVIVPTGKVPLSIKKTRKVSCNGDGDTISACAFRIESKKKSGSFVCGACGCGDSEGVFVGGNVPKFEKLDYPYVNCPASMPGFSNYLPSRDEWNPGERKIAIEAKFGKERLVEEQRIQGALEKRLQKRLGWLEKI